MGHLMHVIVTDAERLQKAVGKVAAVVSKSEANPVQACLKLWTADEKLLVTAVDVTSHQMTLAVEANVQLPGEVLVEADHFSKVITKMARQPMTLTLENQKELVVFSGEDKRTFILFGAEISSFPMESSLPRQVAAVEADLLADIHKTLLAGTLIKEQDVSFAILEEDARLRGYAGSDTSGLLVRCDVPLASVGEPLRFRIPFTVWRSMPLFGKGEVTIHAKDGVVVFARGAEHFLVRVADNEFDMDSLDFIFDKEPSGYVVAVNEKLRTKVKQISVGKGGQIVGVRVVPDERKLLLSAVDKAHGSALLHLGISDSNGDTPRLEFDTTCLERAALAVGSEVITMRYMLHSGNDDSSGVWVIKILDESNPQLRQAVVLPVQTL
jgi:DNA polymerase III sliding clamp (beta) subunit (PCNA family)